MGLRFSRRDAIRSGGLAAFAALAGCQMNGSETTPGHVYAENGTDQEHRLAVAVAEPAEESVTYDVRAWYRLPPEHALEFNGVLEPGRTHYLRAQLETSPAQDSLSTTIDECSDGATGGRVVSIDVQNDGLGVITRDCQSSYEERDLEYVLASEYKVESIEEDLTVTPS